VSVANRTKLRPLLRTANKAARNSAALLRRAAILTAWSKTGVLTYRPPFGRSAARSLTLWCPQTRTVAIELPAFFEGAGRLLVLGDFG